MKLALIVVPLLLAGCAAIPVEWDGPASQPPRVGAASPSADECMALDDVEPSGNAPRLAFFARNTSAVAADLARALNDPLVSSESREPTGGFTQNRFPDAREEWATERGYIELLVDERERPYAWRYWAQGFWAPLEVRAAREAFFDVLRQLGMPTETLADPDVRASNDGQQRVDGAASQAKGSKGLVLEGHPYGAPGADFWIVRDGEMGERSQFQLRVMHDLANASATLPWDEAKDVAWLAARCYLRDAPNALATMQAPTEHTRAPHLFEESVAYTLGVSYSETPTCYGKRFLPVEVDAVTGAVLRVGPSQAGCVE